MRVFLKAKLTAIFFELYGCSFAQRCILKKTVKKQNKNKKKHVFFDFIWFLPCFFNWPHCGKKQHTVSTVQVEHFSRIDFYVIFFLGHSERKLYLCKEKEIPTYPYEAHTKESRRIAEQTGVDNYAHTSANTRNNKEKIFNHNEKNYSNTCYPRR